MAFGIIRVKNLHIEDLAHTQKHNNREFVPSEFGNIKNNGAFFHTVNDELHSEKTIEDAVMEKIQGVHRRKNSVVALEYVCAISEEAMRKSSEFYHTSSTLDFLRRFVEDKHGIENVVSYSYHEDETNPHIHVIVVPLAEKTTKWKNAKGHGEKVEKRLCATDFTGDKEKLRQLQTDYFNYITGNKRMSNVWEEAGIEFRRGKDARDVKKYYSKMTNHLVGNALKEFYEAQRLHKEQKISNEQYNAIEKATEAKITAISDNMEKKAEKDRSAWKQNQKWNENSFGM